MAKNASSNEDPSIEEILDSIRQIISEDDSEPEEEVKPSSFDVKDIDPPPVAKPVAAPPPIPEPIEEQEDPFEDDVFELTDKIEDEPAEKPKIEVDLVDIFEEPEPAPRFEEPKLPVEEDPDAILTEAAENAAYEAITSLVRKTAVEHNGITLEDIVRAELKPLLRAWLDKNLPIIIDRLVREELERVSKRALEE